MMNLLDKIESPDDLKKLPIADLKKVAAEIRKMIVDVVSQSGGHLASSLGAVDLTIALHYVFDAPADKIIWDVGHQAYAHKILTGRRRSFDTIRKLGGLSGFTRISESQYDAFTTGHSSTSISAGLGIATAKHLKNEKSKVIAVIGDGSMTAGLAFEALNQAGGAHEERDLIVILNDNEMSISRNVGALSSLLSRTFSKKKLQDLRKDFGTFLKSLPKIGDDMYQLAKKSVDSFKTFVTPGMLFEAFNFEYFGPIDGHNINHLIEILENIKFRSEPVLLHVTTKKGKGYPPAERNPVYFHGCGSFDVETGTCAPSKISVPSYTEVFGETMVDLAWANPKVIAVSAAMPEGTGLSRFAAQFPDRFFDVGIAEPHGVTFAAGLAVEGFIPVVAIYSTFLQRAYDQILHDVCIESLHVVFAIDRGGIVGEDGPTHHGLFDFAYLRCLPNMVIMAPKDENELRRMLKTALNHKGPIALRYPRGAGEGVKIEDPMLPVDIGKAEVLCEGDDVVLLAIGSSVVESMKARNILEKENIHATVVNCRFVKPIDAELIVGLAEKVKKFVTVEENVLQGGFGSAVLECLNDNGVSGYSLKRIGIQDTFVEHGPQSTLRSRFGLDAVAIARAAVALVR
ncbi:MAG: 1-deoxy-D-xylulose-5-phosphate synthase [Deltaproteobacteria bacterium]|nr:1-deoxy-D-xylulose-5-phosphate synthase [Deltaproteobacteria bacterium]